MTTHSHLQEQEQNLALSGWTIRVRGTVQGVGFRPTVFKLAERYGISGHVLNDGDGVLIEAWASEKILNQFVQAIKTEAPPLAHIENLEHHPSEGPQAFASFFISESISSPAKTNISADAATCTDCLNDVFNPFSRRFRYPFTNCTHCGPRLSIIKSIPYDRTFTSMAVFAMCEDCKQEYDNPHDRRFHAQPNACHACGPKAWLERADGHPLFVDSLSQLDDVDAVASLIQKGEIVAIKGIGGFHLACDATNETAVTKLRSRKNRYHKPFALMARDVNIIKEHCHVSIEEEMLLRNHAAPIVILDVLSSSPEESSQLKRIAPSVAPGQKTLGFMLPYTPLHHLILKRLGRPIVLTSGNLTDEPQVIDNDDAKLRLKDIADYFLLHNREIINRLDDSVMRIIGGQQTTIRRARGFAPNPISLPKGFEKTPEIIAMGAELKSTFCLIKNNRAIMSQHLGDLEEAKTFADYQHNLKLYTQCFEHNPARVAVDLHPEYLSSKLGRKKCQEDNLALDEIQHHHAHIASCLADNNWALDAGPVLGVALDGLGYGCDETFWGGEFMLADYLGFERLGTFKPVALLGGQMAVKEPWRNTYAHLLAEMGWARFKMDFEDLELTSFLEEKPQTLLNSMLKSGVGSPLASSCGRLFDAVAAAMGICRDYASYEGQAAVELEAIVNRQTLDQESETLAYPFAVPRLNGGGLPYIEPLAVWQAILGDLLLHTDRGVMSARFHKGLAKAIVHMVEKVTTRDDERFLQTVALSGGVFQNKILQELVEKRLSALGFKVLTHHRVPTNDGGISLGQALISAAISLKRQGD
jgi:hydrogenase maturation protein HypF